MSISKQQILNLMDGFARLLGQPLDAAEVRSGWTAGAQRAISDLLVELRTRVISDAALPGISLSRGLDAWGVEGGFLAEKAAELSNSLREYSKSSRL
ncbi:MAG: hypothetical protein ACYC9Z_18275 [Casimicrobiaceae bacterium]